MNKKKSYFVLLILAAVLLFGFNNCTQFVADGQVTSGSSLSVCDSQLKAAFQRTYHPFLRSNCTACHSTAHGSQNLNVAYEAFMARGESLIDYQSTNAHGGNNFDATNQTRINAFKPSWTQAKNNYLNCLDESATVGGNAGLRTTSKAIPNIMATATNNNWVGIEWDLETEAEGLANGTYGAILRIEARLNRENGEIAGLFLRNPTLRLKAEGQNILVDGLMIYVGGVKQTAVTTYTGVSQIVNTTTAVNLAGPSGAAYITYTNFIESTTLGLEITEISFTNQMPDPPEGPVVTPPVVVELPDVPIPDGGVTWTQLTTASSPYRVFNRACVSCHGNNNGRLRLSNYEESRDNAALIMQRMNSTTNPMPPTGRLRQNDRDLVQSWVNSGAPR